MHTIHEILRGDGRAGYDGVIGLLGSHLCQTMDGSGFVHILLLLNQVTDGGPGKLIRTWRAVEVEWAGW